MRKLFFLPFLFFVSTLQAKKEAMYGLTSEPGKPKLEAPWLTGPLLSPTSATIPAGHYDIEPYLVVIANTARYGSDWKAVKMETLWNVLLQPFLQFGLTKWLDFQFNPTLFYNFTKGAASWEVGDILTGFDIQLYRHGKHLRDWITHLKLIVREIVPVGHYQKLNPKKLGTDVGGEGSWQTNLGLVWGNMFYLGKDHFLHTYLTFQYFLPAPVHVKKLNIYGGGPGTDGMVYPAQNCILDLAAEVTLTKHWVFSMDIVGTWGFKTRFKGKTIFPNTEPPFTQFSLAPAIEYNWNASLGIIFGPWFTIAGRNAPQFTSGIFAVNYYH